MQQIPFSSIKILKAGVTIVPAEIEDTDDNNWKVGSIETDKLATAEMQDALQKYVPEVIKRLHISEERTEFVTIQGVTIGYKDGFKGIKIHFKVDSDYFVSPFNSHLPFIYECADEDPEDDKPFLTDEMIEALDELVKATQDYLKFTPRNTQLTIFGDAEMIEEADVIPE